MKTIRFHRVDNKHYPRGHGPWFKNFSEYCKQYFNIEWIDYATEPDQGLANIELQTEVSSFGKTPPLSDVDCVIENLETNNFIVLSFTEYFNSYVVHYLKSNFCQKVCLTHFSYHNIFHWMQRDYLLNSMNKVSPWFFGVFENFDIDHYRQSRKNCGELNTDLFYKGSGQNYREVIEILHDRNLLDRSTVPFTEYLDKLTSTKCALSYYTDLDKYYTAFHHPGEFCYRDMEYLSIGVPYIRIEYKDAVYNGLLPNYHYISIPREYAYDAYRTDGNVGVANLIEEKYNQVIQEDDFLNFISKNQLEWYDSYAKWPQSAQFTIKLTGMDTWI
jgi:hypothetical protein